MTTTNTNPTLDLWKAMGEAGIKTRITRYAGKFMYRYGSSFEYDLTTSACLCPITDEDAMILLTGHAEKWLRGRGWECVHLAYNKGINCWCKADWNLAGVASLPDAIIAECGRG